MRKTFLTLFPAFESIGPAAIHKDVGALPMNLSLHCGWDSTIAFLSKGELSEDVMNVTGFQRNVSLVTISESRFRILSVIRILCYLIKHSKNFQVLNIYHGSMKQMLLGFIYRLNNPDGIVYCKLDMNHLTLREILESKRGWSKLKWRLKQLLSKRVVDLYTAETREVFHGLKGMSYFRGKIHYIPNGVNIASEQSISQMLDDKKNIILTVSRLGAPEKNTELLIDALSRISPSSLKNWKVLLVGPVVQPGFADYLKQMTEDYPHLQDVIELTGRIDDREFLNEIYKSAKIFCLTSNFESFGFVLAEAMSFGNYIISSDLPSARDLTVNGTIGCLFPIGNVDCLQRCLMNAINDERNLVRFGRSSYELIRQDYTWENVVNNLDALLMDSIKARK